MRSLIKTLERENPSSDLYPKSLSQLGQWLHETRSENPHRILSDCFRKSLDVSLTLPATDKKSPSVSSARQVLAAYADSLYKDIVVYVESREFEMQQKLMKIRQGKAEELNKLKTQTSDQEVRRASHFMTHETIKDESEFETLFQQREIFLIQVAIILPSIPFIY